MHVANPDWECRGAAGLSVAEVARTDIDGEAVAYEAPRDFKADPTWIAGRLRNRITPQQAEESLQLLQRLGMIEEKNGVYTTKDPLSSTFEDDIVSLLGQGLHRSFLNAAIDSVTNDEPPEREISGLIVPLSKDQLPQFKKALREFRREMNRRFSTPTNNEEIYYLNLSLFPLTKRRKP